MRKLLTLLSGAALALVVAWPVAAQDNRRDDRDDRRAPVWIGAMCVPAADALRAQLQIDDGVGLAVAEIVPDSPAAKAGLKVHDVIVGIGGKPLKNVGELMDAVADAGEKPLKLDLYRAGKQETVEVEPAERPRGDVPHRIGPFGAGRGPQSPEQMREWLDKMRQNLPESEVKRMQEWIAQMQRGEHQPFQMKLFGPGVLMQGAPGIPKGVKVLIKKEADKPTEIHVERGDEKWDITEKELDKLPKDLQGPIGAMLGGHAAHGAAWAGPGGAAAGVVGGSGDADVRVQIDGRPVPMHPFTIPLPPQGSPAAEFEALKRQVEQLQRRLDELNKENENNAPAKKKV